MTTRYVDGTNGNDTWDGLAPNFVSGTNGPKATLNGVEDTPVVAGDLVHVRPGVYRELLTVDVSGTVGNTIEYRGDYSGLIWSNSTKAIVRVTGSDNDQSATRANCVSLTSKNYRIFTGFHFDVTTGSILAFVSPQNCTIQKCFFQSPGTNAIQISGASQLACTVQDCRFMVGYASNTSVHFTHSSNLSDLGHLVQRCILEGGAGCVSVARTGGITIKNCTLHGRGSSGILISTALPASQTVTVNNCIIVGFTTGLSATVTGEITENYNTLYGNTTDRSNTNTGANSISYPPLYDSRWFFELVFGSAGPNAPKQIVSQFDLASFSALINVAGTSPPSTDMRGTAVQGAQREWGALEYDSTLKVRVGEAPRARSLIGLG